MAKFSRPQHRGQGVRNICIIAGETESERSSNPASWAMQKAHHDLDECAATTSGALQVALAQRAKTS